MEPRNRPPRTVVLADDDRVTRERVARLLEDAGFRVLACSSGTEVLQHYRRGGVDLALLDAVMPEMGGLECCRLLKAMAEGVFFPVVLFTSRADPAQRAEGLRLGADDFVAKPFDDGELVARIENMLRIRDMHAAVYAAKANLDALAGRDGASALQSESYFRSRVHQEFKRSERYQQPLALVLIELKGLEAMAFEFGQERAQKAFREAAERVLTCVRETDVGARFDRRTIALILPSTHFQGSLVVAERVWRALAPPSGDVTEGALEAVVGIGLFPSRDVVRTEDLVERAKAALAHVRNRPGESICAWQHSAYLFRPSAEPPAPPHD